MVSKFENKTVEELKEICRQKNITGYSKLKKEDLIKLVKKNSKRKNVKVKKSKKGGTNNNKLILTNENIKKAVNDWLSNKGEATELYGHISEWDTSNVTNMNYLFSINKDTRNIKFNDFNDDISNWNVSNVSTMKAMFAGAIIFNQDLNNWNTSNVKDMESMFQTARSFNGNISEWNVSNVSTMKAMFAGAAKFNQDLDKWNTSKVEDMESMFRGAKSFNGNISNWNVSNVKNMEAMFYLAIAFNQPLNDWNVSNVSNMDSMFLGASSFNQPINTKIVERPDSTTYTAWDVSKVTTMAETFYQALAFNQPIDNWDVSKVDNMNAMFAATEAFNQPIDNWDVSNVTDMSFMFSSAQAFNQPIGSWDVSKVTNMGTMFPDATSFNQPIGDWNVSSVSNMYGMFYHAEAFNQPIGGWNVSKVETMDYMFDGARSFDQNISNWVIQDNTTFTDIFKNCSISRQNKPPIILSRNQLALIPQNTSMQNTSNSSLLIKKNILKSNNNTCYTKLYDYILKLDNNILINKKFQFEAQKGIDVGGLSRTVFDLFYKTYIHKFFKYSDNNNKNLGMIIKKNISNNENIAKFYEATNKLIILAEKGKLQIFIPINEELLKLLKNEDPIQEINLNKKNSYDNLQLLNNKIRKTTYGPNSKISDVLMKKNENKNEKKWNKNFDNIKNNNEKKEVYFRRYLYSLGFRNDKYFEIMKEWIKEYWLKNPTLFTNKMPSYAKEDFMKRIILKEGGTEQKLNNLKKNSTNSIINNYPNVEVLLEYIKNGTDKDRKKFCNWATGSIFSNSLITITLNNYSGYNKQGNQVPFQSHTCFNRIDVYKTNPNPLYNRNQLNAQISGNSTSFHIE